ncbi:transcription factor JunD [Eublepharis macularius]|uniref:Transcription factor JunD n=1 Tax=Eublepharis macularius TaxID=481883 RepID=A0AA97JFZ9_EUBMA|nr:transcription factor JunD [Eublepharis macularius]
MDIPFYHDEVLTALAPPSPGLLQPFPDGGAGTMMKKEALALALGEQVAAAAGLKAPDGGGPAALLAAAASPELGLLKLASPELERLIIQSNGLVTTTPTSGAGAFPFAKGPDEQEFAAGFVKALEDLHQQSQLGGVAGPELPSPAGPAPEPPIYANLSSFGGGYAGEGGPFAGAPARLPGPPPKDEPQTVPEVGSFGESPPLSPIDMDTQERIKAERKRLRNRIAASKCRRRKLERISRLEEKVKSLKSQNTELASTASLLREQVAQLKQKVLSHVNSGCQLLPQPHQVPAY